MNDAAENQEEETKEAPEATEEVEAAEESAEEPKKAGPIVLEEVDRLKAENVNLRLLNTVSRETLAQHALQEAGRQRQEANTAVMALRKELEEKYSIDFRTHQVDEKTGAVTPRGLPPHLQALSGGRG